MNPNDRSMTATEKIIADHSHQERVEPGDIVDVKVDFAVANDITTPPLVDAFEQMQAAEVFDPDRIALVLSHFLPAKDIDSARQASITRKFAENHSIPHLFEAGEGIEHVLLPERGLVLPGEIVLGADSHTCTYGALNCMATGVGSTDLAYTLATGETWMRVPESIKCTFTGDLRPWVTGKDLMLHVLAKIGSGGAVYKSLEFTGPTVEKLTMTDRLTMANMAVEAGAKNGIFPPDSTTYTYLRGRAQREYTAVHSDPESVYSQRHHFSADDIDLQVSLPHSPANAVPVSEAEGLKIDRVFIGSCTNGRLQDLKMASHILSRRTVHPGVVAVVIPGSRAVYAHALRDGVIDTLTQAGACVSVPTCGPCLGGHMGVLGPGESCASTSNRNFAGRMGHPESETYLCSPAVAAASAAAGEICHPEQLGLAFDDVPEGSGRL